LRNNNKKIAQPPTPTYCSVTTVFQILHQCIWDFRCKNYFSTILLEKYNFNT